MAVRGSAGLVIADRYTLISALGHGAHGDVWVAHDRIVDERVALKWMRFVHGKMQARIRREITTLRTLRFPGIVRLLDEGVADERPFMVMELIDGRPFPGAAATSAIGTEPTASFAADATLPQPSNVVIRVANAPGSTTPRLSWPHIAAPTLALLETLVHVHAAAIVHRDLKPENVLVRPDGHPVMLDFSVSFLQTQGGKPLTSRGQIVGTPLYLAPEQILEKPADARTDLYALGVMLHEALTGRVPHDALDMYSIVRARLGGPVPPIQDLDPTIPPAVAAVINRLLAVRPEDRFSSATEVLAALRGGLAPLTSPPWSGSAEDTDEVTLRGLFAGPDRLFHLREDAARVLYERTRGNVVAIEDELGQWVRVGLARRNGSTFVIDHGSIPRLVTGFVGTPAEQRLRELLSAGLVRDAMRTTLELAERDAIQGDLVSATHKLAEGIRLARTEELLQEERDMLSLWTKVALAEATPRALDGVLYELVRTAPANAEVERLQSLLRAALAAPGGNGFQALEMADDLGPFVDPTLERCRQRIRVLAVATRASPSLLAEVLDEIDEWAGESGDPMAELCAAEGHARRRYHEGRFDEAARLFAQAAALDPWMTGKIDATLRSTSALLEAFAHEQARKTAEEARSLARRARHPYLEGRAEWLIRSAEYRLGKTQRPDWELVEAAARVGVQDLEALVCFQEAAVAMRMDMLEVTCDLAERAATIWRSMGRPFARMLARALAISCGAETNDEEVETLVERAIGCKGAGIGVQTLGLFGRVFPEKRLAWQSVLSNLERTVPEEHWEQRIDVLSVRESLEFARM